MLDYITEGVLSIECEDGQQRPVAFLLKSLNETERNYEIHDIEILAVIRGLENQRHLLKILSTNSRFRLIIRTWNIL